MLLSLLPAMLVCIIILIRKSSQKRPYNLPPGPHALPIIGHMHLLGKFGKLRPHQSLCELSKIHGPLMFLRLGSIPVVVASSVEMARQILQTHDLAFSNRNSNMAAIKHIFGQGKDIAFSYPNEHWKLMRRLVATELMSAKGLSFFKPTRTEEISRLMRWVLAESIDACMSPQQMRPKLLVVSNDIIMRMLLGKRVSELGGRQLDVQRSQKASILDLLVEFSESFAKMNVGDYLPSIAWMDLQGNERHNKRLAVELRAFFEGIIHARRLVNIGGHPPNDFLDVLLEASASSDTPTNIMEVLLQLFVAGTDTSAHSIEWALAELIANPGKMRKAQAEIDEVVGRARVIEEADIDHLPFLAACVKESLRLHPAGPLLIPHKTNQACEILGFHILPNTQALVNVWAIGRDPKVWENPTEFYPERFLGASCVSVQGQHFELLPFGSGRRICSGWKLGILTVQIILARLLQGFEWSLPPSYHLDMSETLHLSLSLTTPLVACATPRLPKELY